VEGQSTEEICEELGISESKCWVMLYRARMSLRESLEKRWFLKEGTRAPDKTETLSRQTKSHSVTEPEML
jgi:DNA-directed RNA polymerase specialized sigma subunit